ncbi:hypothetical protein KKF84_03660, partial [Myxococcota bacterium]|nr:hypothetical protein [Myxococcota bacterium]
MGNRIIERARKDGQIYKARYVQETIVLPDGNSTAVRGTVPQKIDKHGKRRLPNSKEGEQHLRLLIKQREQQYWDHVNGVDKDKQFSVFFSEFMSVHADVENKPGEVKNKWKLANHHLLPFFGTFVLSAIDAKLIAKFKKEMKAKTSAQTGEPYSMKYLN